MKVETKTVGTGVPEKSETKVTGDNETTETNKSAGDGKFSRTTFEHESDAFDESDTRDEMQTEETQNEKVEAVSAATENNSLVGDDFNQSESHEAPISNKEQCSETDPAPATIDDGHLNNRSSEIVGAKDRYIQGKDEHESEQHSVPQCDTETESDTVKQTQGLRDTLGILRDSETFKHLKAGIDKKAKVSDKTGVRLFTEMESEDSNKETQHLPDHSSNLTDDIDESKPPSLASVTEDSEGMDTDTDTMPDLVNIQPSPTNLNNENTGNVNIVSPQPSTEEDAPMDLSCHQQTTPHVPVFATESVMTCIKQVPVKSRDDHASKTVPHMTTTDLAREPAIQTQNNMATNNVSDLTKYDTQKPMTVAIESMPDPNCHQSPSMVAKEIEPCITEKSQAVLSGISDCSTSMFAKSDSKTVIQSEMRQATREAASNVTHKAEPLHTQSILAETHMAARKVSHVAATTVPAPDVPESRRRVEQSLDTATNKPGLVAARKTTRSSVDDETNSGMTSNASAPAQVKTTPKAHSSETINNMTSNEGTSTMEVCELRVGDLVKSNVEAGEPTSPIKTVHNIQLQIEEEGTDSNDSASSVQLTKASKSMELVVSLSDKSKGNGEDIGKRPPPDSDQRQIVSTKPTNVVEQRPDANLTTSLVSKATDEDVKKVASAEVGGANVKSPISTTARVVARAQQVNTNIASKSAPSTKLSQSKQSEPEPVVIDLDAGSTPTSTQRNVAMMEKTPTKQLQTKQSQKSPRTPSQTTPKHTPVKSPTPSGKQSFIDNLIATGVPIVIPDDDDDDVEEGETNTEMMPKARSNIFKIKSQLSREQSKGGPPGAYRRNVAMRDSQQYFSHQGETYGRTSTMGQGETYVRPGAMDQGETYARSGAHGQGETYGRPPAVGEVESYDRSTVVGQQQHPTRRPRQASQDLLDMVREQVHRDVYLQPDNTAQTPPRSAVQTGMMSPPAKSTMSPMQSFTPPRAKDLNKKVTFSPVSNVYQIPASTPPRHPSPQRYGTPTRTIPASPRMASPNSSQMSHVRRNIVSPRQQQSHQAQPNRGREPTIVIDDDIPPPPRAPQVTPTKRPTPQQTLTRRPEEVVAQQNQQTRPRQTLPRQQDNAAQQIIIQEPHTVRAEEADLQQRVAPQQNTNQAQVTESPQNLPVIASVTSMAPEPEQLNSHQQHVVTQQQYIVIQQQHLVTQQQLATLQQHMTPQLTTQGQSTGFIQLANEKTPVKRSRSDDTMMAMTSPGDEPSSKRRSTVESSSSADAKVEVSGIKTEPLTTVTHDPTDSSVTVVVKEPLQQTQQQSEPSEETVSPSKRPPEVFIDVDVDDKSTVKRRLNIEQGHITTTSSLTSPDAEASSSFATKNVTSPDSTNTPMSMTTRGKGRGRPRSLGDSNFSCEDCGKNFSTKAALKMHSKTHSGEVFECDVCGKHFSNKTALKKHIYTHFKDKDKDT